MTSLVQLLAGLCGMLVLWTVAWLLWPREPASARPAARVAGLRDPTASIPTPHPANPATRPTRSKTLRGVEPTQILGEDDLEVVAVGDETVKSMVTTLQITRPDEGLPLERRTTLPFMRAVGGERQADAPTAESHEPQTKPFNRAHLVAAARDGRRPRESLPGERG